MVAQGDTHTLTLTLTSVCDHGADGGGLVADVADTSVMRAKQCHLFFAGYLFFILRLMLGSFSLMTKMAVRKRLAKQKFIFRALPRALSSRKAELSFS